MTTPEQYSAFHASNPDTAPEVLGQIAQQRPDLRALVAANPSTPESVVLWLGGLGDVAVDAALRRRVGSPATVTPASPYAAPVHPAQVDPAATATDGAGTIDVAAEQPQQQWTQPDPSHAQQTHTAETWPEHQGYNQQAQPNPYVPPQQGYGPAQPDPYAQQQFGQPGPYAQPQYGQPAYSPAPWDYGPRKRNWLGWAIGGAAAVVLIVGAIVAFNVFRGPQAYGDDPELDAMWDACAAGEAQACDELFSESPIGSEYEDFGASCGGRFPGTDQWCVNIM